MQKTSDLDELEPVTRAPAEIWMFNRRLTLTEAAKAAGVSQASLSRALLPPDAPTFKAASLNLRKKFKRYTLGKVTLDDWPEAIETPIGGAALPPTERRQFTPEGADISHRAAPCETQPSGAS